VIDEKGHADLDATGTDFIFGYQRVDECDDHCGLRRREVAKTIGSFAVSFWWMSVGVRRRLRLRLSERRRRGCRHYADRGPGNADAFQDIASTHTFMIRHEILPR
jgi:hypothetical protein